MLDLSLLTAILFSGAGLGLVLSRGLVWAGWLSLSLVHDSEAPREESMVQEALPLDPPARTVDPLPKMEPLTRSEGSKLTRCHCGLELPEESMAEHAQATGHSKPLALGAFKVGKIWDLQEAVIDTASPQCVKCGKPVPGLKRIGKTIYIQHLGCSGGKRPGEKDRPGPQRKRSNLRVQSLCSICWQDTGRSRSVVEIASTTGRTLRFHEKCLSLQSN